MTRQQEYESKAFKRSQTDQIMPYILFILFLSLWELTASLGMINPFYIQLPLPDPFVSVSHVFG